MIAGTCIEGCYKNHLFNMPKGENRGGKPETPVFIGGYLLTGRGGA